MRTDSTIMALQQLTQALQALSKSVSNFHVGAVSTDDFKPIEEKIEDIRQILRKQKAHWILVNTKHNAHSVTEGNQDVGNGFEDLHQAVGDLRIANSMVNVCLQSCTINDIVLKDKSPPEIKKQVKECLSRLFILSDKLISLNVSMTKALNEELNLKKECQESLLEHSQFLQTQKALRNARLQDANPEILRNKKKLETRLTKINIMKRLMTNMIATASEMLSQEPFLFEMMLKHRDIINIETIIEMARENASTDSLSHAS
ncbi:uncharacterized protein LOC124305662 isoform X1 [Neodiprion virginianus]|uniref:uncharacterized protein LOC124305662 isoform X1 n=2 Tax=Neodiprion virginianus TaxID=2961670 RepID=UPI001EE6D657|nr:uncharacterized protein LOC124305662 isoform X1 [Neodiprion virginianus]